MFKSVSVSLALVAGALSIQAQAHGRPGQAEDPGGRHAVETP